MNNIEYVPITPIHLTSRANKSPGSMDAPSVSTKLPSAVLEVVVVASAVAVAAAVVTSPAEAVVATVAARAATVDVRVAVATTAAAVATVAARAAATTVVVAVRVVRQFKIPSYLLQLTFLSQATEVAAKAATVARTSRAAAAVAAGKSSTPACSSLPTSHHPKMIVVG